MQRIGGVLGGIDYKQFCFQAADSDEYPVHLGTGPPNRLLQVDDSGTAVVCSTGIHMGPINLVIELLDRPPSELDDSHEWEAVAEVDFEAKRATAGLVLLFEAPAAPFTRLQLPAGVGWYRMRGHAVGRALDFDGAVSIPREHHLLQVWAVTVKSEPLVIRADDLWALQVYPP